MFGPPDLDLDLVDEEAREEEVRSQTVRQKQSRDGQKEQGSRSRSLPRSSARSWDSSPPEDRAEEEEDKQPEGAGRERKRRSEKKSRRRAAEEEEREESRHAKASGSSVSAQKSAFSFLRPMSDNEPQHLSDSESAASFSGVSLSAASITTVGWREDSDWRRAESPTDQRKAPGPWLKPSPQRLSRVLIGSQHSGQGLVGGLSI